MKWIQVFVVILLGVFARADMELVLPKAGSVYSGESGSAKFTLGWVYDDTIYPKADDVVVYNVTLCHGSQDGFKCMFNLANDVLAKDVKKDESGIYTLDVEVKAKDAWDGQFFIQLTANAGVMGYSIHYSYRIFLENMEKPVEDPIRTFSGRPWGEVHITADRSGEPFNPTTMYIANPYLSQTGSIRWAPIQTQPGTKVTMTTWTNKFPKSSVSYFKTLQTDPTMLLQYSTITVSPTDSFTTDMNYATPAPFPKDNGGWYDPKKRMQSLTTRKVNVNKL